MMYVFVVSKRSVICGNRFKLKTYKFSSVKNINLIDKYIQLLEWKFDFKLK